MTTTLGAAVPANALDIDYEVSPEGRFRALLYGCAGLTVAVASGAMAVATAVTGAQSLTTVALVAIFVALCLWLACLSAQFLRDAMSSSPRVRIRKEGLYLTGVVRETFVRWDQLLSHEPVTLRKLQYSLHVVRFREGQSTGRRRVYLPDDSGLSPDAFHLGIAIALRLGKSTAEIEALASRPFPLLSTASEWREARHGGIRGA